MAGNVVAAGEIAVEGAGEVGGKSTGAVEVEVEVEGAGEGADPDDGECLLTVCTARPGGRNASRAGAAGFATRSQLPDRTSAQASANASCMASSAVGKRAPALTRNRTSSRCSWS